jgi:hypothetical protein
LSWFSSHHLVSPFVSFPVGFFLISSVIHLLEGNPLSIKKIHAVYNPTLLVSFALTKQKLDARAQNATNLFFLKKWLTEGTEEEKEAKQEVFDAFEERARVFPWNKSDSVCFSFLSLPHKQVLQPNCSCNLLNSFLS